MSKQPHKSGFAPIPILTVIFGLLCIAAALWFFVVRSKDVAVPAGNGSKAVTNFEECAAAGNPIMESYPEQCSANGRRFTKQISNTTSDDVTNTWKTFTPDTKRYTIRIPDGWEAVTMNNNLYVRDADKLIYTAGKTATISSIEGGWDGGSPFALYDPGSYADQIVREGNEVSTLQTKQGLTVNKYVYNQTTEPEGIGYPLGAKVYNYYFDAAGKYIQVSHMISQGSADQSAWVEKAISTLTVN